MYSYSYPRSSPEDRIAKIRDMSLSDRDRLCDQVIPNLVGIIDNCSSVAPKAAHVAMSLLSLFIAHRPVEVLGRLDVEPLSKALFKWVQISACVSGLYCMYTG